MQVDELLQPFPIKEFHPFPRALLGPGSHELIGPEALKLGFKKTLVMTSGLRGSDIIHAITESMKYHGLEHLPRGADAAVLAGMLRVGRRAVVAVPFEDEPTAAWGHVRTFDLADLDALGAATGLPYTVEEHHGGWLVVTHGTKGVFRARPGIEVGAKVSLT
jgi:hypothetical protein